VRGLHFPLLLYMSYLPYVDEFNFGREMVDMDCRWSCGQIGVIQGVGELWPCFMRFLLRFGLDRLLF
jgi:hypothetical protein